MLVRRARSERRVLIEVFEGMLRGIVLLPDTVLTKICIVSSASEAVEDMLLMLEERAMVAVLVVVVVAVVIAEVAGDDVGRQVVMTWARRIDRLDDGMGLRYGRVACVVGKPAGRRSGRQTRWWPGIYRGRTEGRICMSEETREARERERDR